MWSSSPSCRELRQDGRSFRIVGVGLYGEGDDSSGFLPAGAVEVLVQRKEGERFQLPECSTELLFDPVNFVKELTPIDTHLTAAEFPVRAQEKVKFEDLILPLVQGSPADKAKIGDVLFILESPGRFSLTPWI